MMIISFMKPQLRSIVVLRRGRGGCHNQVMATHTIYYIHSKSNMYTGFGNSSMYQLLTDSICVIAIHCNLSLTLSTIAAAVFDIFSCRFLMNEATDNVGRIFSFIPQKFWKKRTKKTIKGFKSYQAAHLPNVLTGQNINEILATILPLRHTPFK